MDVLPAVERAEPAVRCLDYIVDGLGYGMRRFRLGIVSIIYIKGGTCRFHRQIWSSRSGWV